MDAEGVTHQRSRDLQLRSVRDEDIERHQNYFILSLDLSNFMEIRVLQRSTPWYMVLGITSDDCVGIPSRLYKIYTAVSW